jgi:hypothetical protein
VSRLKGKFKNYLIISTCEVSMPCKFGISSGASEAMKFVARRCVLSLIILLLLDLMGKKKLPVAGFELGLVRREERLR